jgi:ribosome-associated protein
MTTKKTSAPSASATSGKKDVQKLQRAVVDGLEDVKAQDIQVFDTEALSSLFERVVVASGTSNRQTKALASSVVDAVRKAGFPKPRIEGEGNGEWIIVDCGQVVVHVMQPVFRSYYRLEELWGEKPVRLKLGAEKPGLVKAEVVDAAPTSKTAAKAPPPPSLRRSSAAKAGVAEAFPSKAALKKAAAKKAPAAKAPAKKTPASKSSAASAAKVPTVVVNAPAKKVARKAVPKAAPKPQAKAAPARAAVAKPTAAKPVAARKSLAVKAPVRKPAAAKTAPRKA